MWILLVLLDELDSKISPEQGTNNGFTGRVESEFDHPISEIFRLSRNFDAVSAGKIAFDGENDPSPTRFLIVVSR